MTIIGLTRRYMIKYAIKRLIRYAKYAAVGAIVAAIGGGLLGTIGSGLAFFAAPGIGAGMAIGVATAVVKVSHLTLLSSWKSRSGRWSGRKSGVSQSRLAWA